MRHALILCLILSTTLLSQILVADSLNHTEILAKCDAARGNMDGVEWEVTVTEETAGNSDQRRIHVQARGFDMVAETLAPPRQKQHKLLLVKNNMWFYKPGLSKPVPVSLRQKLTGQAANGDIASTNYASDYEILETSDATHEGEPCTLYQLKATSKSVSYARIHYWVSKERQVGLRADYYNASGSKRLKTATMLYENSVETDGHASPFISEMIIADTATSDTVTRLKFSKPKLGKISARAFNLQTLTR